MGAFVVFGCAVGSPVGSITKVGGVREGFLVRFVGTGTSGCIGFDSSDGIKGTRVGFSTGSLGTSVSIKDVGVSVLAAFIWDGAFVSGAFVGFGVGFNGKIGVGRLGCGIGGRPREDEGDSVPRGIIMDKGPGVGAGGPSIGASCGEDVGGTRGGDVIGFPLPLVAKNEGELVSGSGNGTATTVGLIVFGGLVGGTPIGGIGGGMGNSPFVGFKVGGASAGPLSEGALGEICKGNSDGIV